MKHSSAQYCPQSYMHLAQRRQKLVWRNCPNGPGLVQGMILVLFMRCITHLPHLGDAPAAGSARLGATMASDYCTLQCRAGAWRSHLHGKSSRCPLGSPAPGGQPRHRSSGSEPSMLAAHEAGSPRCGPCNVKVVQLALSWFIFADGHLRLTWSMKLPDSSYCTWKPALGVSRHRQHLTPAIEGRL